MTISTTDAAFRGDLMDAARQIQELAFRKMSFAEMTTDDWFEASGLQSLPSRLDRYTDGSVDACDAMIDKLGRVSGALRDNVHDDIADVRMSVHDWQGTAAESFKTYLGEVETATANQLAFTDELVAVMRTERDFIRGVRADVAAVVENTITALESLDDGGGGGGMSLGTALEVVGIVLATVTAIATLPTGAGAVMLGAVFAGGVLGAAGTIRSAQESQVGGPTVTDVLSSLAGALGDVNRSVIVLRRAVRAGMNDLADAAHQYHAALYPRLLTGTPQNPVPSINGTYTLDDFRPPVS
ncbi:MAG: hypothetical protein HOV79_31865 [Hamadaea sp.]|nr:hypothetical protein [Hamadaea sp.]